MRLTAATFGVVLGGFCLGLLFAAAAMAATIWAAVDILLGAVG